MKRTLVYRKKSKIRGQNGALCQPSWGHTPQANPHRSGNAGENAASVDLGVTNKF